MLNTMRISISARKTLEENAAGYFEKAKKAKRKLDGVHETIARFGREVPATAKTLERSTAAQRKKEWYEQYRWSFTSDGALIIGGRDAGGNESLIKKHTDNADIVFHTESPGSPFSILKGNATETAIAEAAQFCAAYSKAWKSGLTTTDVFWVRPEQLSKTANSGEFIGRGAFMIRGEKHFLHPRVEIALGVLDDRATAGTTALFTTRGGLYAVLAPGKDKSSDVAKKLSKKLGLSSDDWVPLIPAGGATITGFKKVRGTASTGAENENQ